MGYLNILKWLEGLIPPAAFLAILWMLLEFKCPRKIARWWFIGFLAAEAVLQGVVYSLGDNPEMVFTLLPLTFYFPAVILNLLLCQYSFFSSTVGCLFALLCRELLLTVQKLLSILTGRPALSWIRGALLLLGAAGLVVAVRRFLRGPFRDAAGELDAGWSPLLFLPVMLLALYSYLLSDSQRPLMLVLLLLTALAATLSTARLFFSQAAQRQIKASRIQMEALRQNYELLQKRLELGRRYRHDARHHMLTLSALLQQGDTDGALDYISGWQGQLTQIESRSWCRDPAVNAVLSAYITQAEEAGYTVEAEVSLSGEIPYEETDLCVMLANALENALHACQAVPEDLPRRIRLELTLTDHRRLTLRLENSCPVPVEFDSEGFPAVGQREGHGQGLKSIAAVAEKYHGMFRCDWKEGIFSLRVVLLNTPTQPSRPLRRLPVVCAGVLLGIFLLNCMPALAKTLEDIPVLGAVIRVADLRSYSLFWGGTGISAEEPILAGDGPIVDEAEAAREALIQELRETFLDYALRKYQGYAAQDVTFEVLRDDERWFILRFDATLNAGGSGIIRRHMVLDKDTGQVLALGDLFQAEVNYLFPISREILAQMEEQTAAGTGTYFLPGGIWDESECFRSIEEEQDFYVNEQDQLVIVFDEYKVAPGSMGAPEFTIPTDALEGLLAQPSVLK